MSVVTKRKASPPTRITVQDDIGDRLVLVPSSSRETLLAELKFAAPRGHENVRITAADARELAAALVEWADSAQG